jgi:transposase
MGKKTPPTYTAEYRRRMVELVRTSGRSPEDIAPEYGLHPNTIRNWIKQADIDAGARAGLTTDERAELARLRRENAQLQEEREILKKAAAWFAVEANRTPKKRSRS